MKTKRSPMVNPTIIPIWYNSTDLGLIGLG